jgi:leader peptidase (prepilin peptidase)/N-methyltransferase
MLSHVLLPAVLGLPLGGLLDWASAHVPRLSHSGREAEAQAGRVADHQPDEEMRGGNLRPGVLDWRGIAAVAAASGLLVTLELRFESFWSRPLVLAVSIFLLLVALVDLKHRVVLNAMVVPAAAVALVAQVIASPRDLVVSLVGGAFGLAPFLVTALVKPGQMGGGDVKLAGLVGLILGFPHVLWALTVAIITGGIVSLVLLMSSEWELTDQVPYGPFLCLGAFVALLHDPLSPILVSLAH